MYLNIYTLDFLLLQLDYKDASLATCYLSTQRTFGQSFELYLKKILRVLGETAIAVRTKAMKCLAAVVEVDPGLLERGKRLRAVSSMASKKLVAGADLVNPLSKPRYFVRLFVNRRDIK